MLVLSRRPGEKIVIGDNIVITLLSIQGQRARLAVDAPRTVPVHRMELLEREPPSWPEPASSSSE
jgi:carbon storage regulator